MLAARAAHQHHLPWLKLQQAGPVASHASADPVHPAATSGHVLLLLHSACCGLLQWLTHEIMIVLKLHYIFTCDAKQITSSLDMLVHGYIASYCKLARFGCTSCSRALGQQYVEEVHLIWVADVG
jgi:hypothetical protein